MSLTVHTAALNKQLMVIRSLLADDPNLINSLDVDDRTPLHWAASSGALDIVRFLLDQKAEVDRPDNSGWTPLLIAVSAGHTEIVQELIGNTPLHLAMDSAHAETAVLLINAGADRTRENLENETPENVPGVGGKEQKLARQYVVDHCGEAS
ncbi:hypothetical protein H1R20_g2410, partial [Candolleomyces eurysporus]